MEKFRISNDLSIFWSITNKDGSPYTLSDKTVRLFVTHPRGRVEVTQDITIQDNVICWLFRGSKQRYLGTYRITAEIQATPADRTIRKDIPEAFELVGSTQYEQTEIGRPDINEDGELTLATSLDIFQIKPIIPQVGPNRNWWVDGVDTGKSSVGLTAYEFAKEQGYEGTEEEYAAECLAVPVLNEESRTATEEARTATEGAKAQLQSVSGFMSNVAEPTITRAELAAEYAEQAKQEADAATAAATEAAAAAESAISNIAPILNEKQDKLVSGKNIKTLNGQSLLGEGDVEMGMGMTHVTDFTVEDLSNLYHGRSDYKQCDLLRLQNSLANKEIILVPYGPEDVKGYSLLHGYSEDLLYFSVTDERGNIYSVETDTNAREIYSENITFISPVTNQGRIEEQDQFIEDLQNTKIDREADDYYPKLAVGLADNLAGVDVVDSEINFRRSGGGAITDGVARIESIKGNSVVWNQIFSGGLAGNKASVENVNNGAVITAEAATFINAYIPFNFIPNHKYLYSTIATLPYADTVVIGTETNGNAQYRQMVSGANTPTAIEGIVSCVAPAATFYIFPNWNVAASVGDSFKFENIRIVDLTKMFGAGNEPTTIEEFYARIPMGVDMNAYNEGEVIHMDVQSIESQGVNAWDEEWELGQIDNGTGEPVPSTGHIRSKNYIPVIAGATYYCLGSFLIIYYDEKFKQVDWWSVGGSRTLTMPYNVHYVRLYKEATTYNHDICINLSDPAVDGKYFPYIKRVEDLSIIRKYFPQGMKSAPTAHDAIRYNKESGKWEKVEATGIRAYQDGDADNAAYLTDGKVTCYPLAEPIVTELDEADQFKDLDYKVWNAGTEKAIAEGKSAPLAADITYGFNAIGKIKELESLVAALRAKVGI